MSARLTSSVIILVIFFLWSGPGRSGPLIDSQEGREKKAALQGAAREGLELLLSRNYPEASQFIQALIADPSTRLLGHFGMMSMTQIRNLENYDFRFEEAYHLWEKPGREMALQVKRDPAASGWDLLLAGGILGVSGLQRAHNDQWIPALRDGQAAMQTLRASRRTDPRLIDPLLGIGLYDYWRSHYTRLVKFLPVFPDRRKQGKEEVARVMREGEAIAPVAAIALAFLEYQEKNYSGVLQSTRPLLVRYPQNVILLMLEGQAYFQLKRFDEAKGNFERILSIDPAITKSYLWLGLIYAGEGRDTAMAKAYLLKYLSLEKKAPRSWRKRAEEGLKKLEADKLFIPIKG